MEKFTYFWKSESPFSQWHAAIFKEKNMIYNCAEQYMMHKKALLFNDTETAKKIMEAGYNPRRHKELGRQVRPFDNKTWEAHAPQIVYEASRLKFTQNPNLLLKLAQTKGTTLVEASPFDKIWGIGLSVTDSRSKYRNTWLGKNLLGEALTKVRNDLTKEGIIS